MNKQEKLETVLNNHFKSHSTITTGDLRTMVYNLFPEDKFTHLQVSKFLQEDLDLEYTVNSDKVYIYHKPNIMTTTTNYPTVESVIQFFVAHKTEITKTKIKTALRNAGAGVPVVIEPEKYNLVWNGNYTSDNHKIYIYVAPGKHLSKTKHEIVDIKQMPKPYLRNAIMKIVHEDYDSIEHAFNNPQSELNKLLSAYYTYDIRQQVNNI